MERVSFVGATAHEGKAMLDVHAPHEPVHGWRDFFLHIATITIGLLIAISLEASVELIHHRHQVAETREALQRELAENRRRFGDDTRYFRQEAAMLANDFLVLRFVQDHPGGRAEELPGVLILKSSYARMNDAAWKTAQATAVTALMAQDEVQKTAELYGFFERMDQAHEEEADTIAAAYSLLADEPDPSRLSPTQVGKLEDMFRQVLAKHLRHGFLMQNLAEEYSDFRPAPSREELESWIHLGGSTPNSDLQRARELTAQRLGAPFSRESLAK